MLASHSLRKTEPSPPVHSYVAGPSVLAIVGDKTALRDDLQKRVEGQKSLSISSCERLLETRGMTIEGTDTLIFCGDGDPMDRKTVERLIGRALKLRRVVMVSSVGTERANLFPFSLQNALTGVFDKKRGVELGVMELSKKKGFAYTVLRLAKVPPPHHTRLEPTIWTQGPKPWPLHTLNAPKPSP